MSSAKSERLYIMIVIVTLNDPENYGNRLQNYALTLMLQNMVK